ncbi:MAG: DUF3261 domain-containing protein [Desulfovibrio sp.]|jgi:hypothetical protein|nr:DUF3261 domain-containing protein [Desulfovibrio sp.]
MRGLPYLFLALLLSAAVLPLPAGCMAQGRKTAPPGSAQGVLTATLRHHVQVHIPGHSLPSFDGLLAITASPTGNPARIRAVGLGGMGLTLFDLTVTPAAFHTALLHPALRRIPSLDAHIAHCIQGIWFAALPEALAPRAGNEAQEGRGVSLTRIPDGQGGQDIRAAAPDGSWVARFADTRPQPETILFENMRPPYLVQIRLLISAESGKHRP